LSYYAIDGGNERKLGFNIPSSIIRDVNLASVVHHTGDLCNSGKSSLSGHLEDVQGNNYFIAVSKEGLDAAGNSTLTAATDEFDVIAIGNGFISDYSVEASVGSIPSVSVSVEAFNIKADDHVSGTLPGQDPTIPAVDVTGGTTGTYGSAKHYIIPTYQTGILDSAGATATLSALKPGDIELTISSASSYQGITDLDLAGKAHIQSFSLSIPMSRTVLQRLGSTFGYARVIDVPLTISCSISAVVSELQASAAGSTKANVYEMLCSNQLHDLTLSLNSKCGGADVKQLKYIVKNARMEGESFSNSIGSDQTVDISFTAQVGGANDTANGVIMEGNYEAWTSLSYWPIGAQKDDDASYGV
jgi:hypothetical protein